MAQSTALLLGATGLIGSHCLQILLAHPDYSKVTVLVRKNLSINHLKLNQVILKDWDDLETKKDVFSVDHVYCCIGSTIKKAGSQKAFRNVDFDIPVMSAKLGFSQGIKLFSVVSALGANAASSNFYLKTKGTMEAEVAASGVPSVHIFRPSFLLGRQINVRLGEQVAGFLAKIFNPILLGLLKKFRPIKGDQVAKSMVKEAFSGILGIKVFQYSEMVN